MVSANHNPTLQPEQKTFRTRFYFKLLLQNGCNSQLKFAGWQICFDTHFYARQDCVASCQRVGRASAADRVGYSPCSKPLAVEGYLLQQMPERDRCFSSSMRQIPGARFILYLFIYLLSQCGSVPPSCTVSLWDKPVPLSALGLWWYCEQEKSTCIYDAEGVKNGENPNEWMSALLRLYVSHSILIYLWE